MGIPSLLLSRWRSRNLVGQNRHVGIVRVRPGYMHRTYTDSSRIDDGSPIFPPLIWKGHNHEPWMATWYANGPWKTLPNIQSTKWQRSPAQRGTSTMTIVMDNISFPEAEGVSGLYHIIDRGHFSPSRGIRVDNRSPLWQTNDWENALNAAWQVEVWEGYGSGDEVTLLDAMDETTHSWARPGTAIHRTWTGIIQGCDSDTHPDHITLTATDFGIMFSDERMMGNNKAAEIRSPVTFADRKITQGELKLGGPFLVSSGTVDSDGEWQGAPRAASSDHDWIEMPLPAGYYTEFFVAPAGDDMEMSVSVFVGPNGGSMDRTVPLAGSAWIDGGVGPAPGGLPRIRKIGSVSESPARRWDFGHGLDLPDGSKLRLTFTNLPRTSGQYVAGVRAMAGYRYGSDPLHPPNGAAGVQAKHWILVEDASEVVRTILIWAGFKEWHVEDFGWTIHYALHYGEDKFYGDVIDDMTKQGNFVFYMAAPTDDDRSLGVPHFEYQRAPNFPGSTLEVRDTDMTEAFTLKESAANLPYVMRYRGSLAKKNQGGQSLGQDLILRHMATYYPPWSGDLYTKLNDVTFRSAGRVRRTAGILRHFTETLGVQSTVALNSTDECLFACVLAAIQYALGMATGQLQIAGIPGIEMNMLISVVEESTGVNSRMLVDSIDSQHNYGEKGSWHMTISGPMIDTEEMDALRDDYAFALRLAQRRKVAN